MRYVLVLLFLCASLSAQVFGGLKGDGTPILNQAVPDGGISKGRPHRTWTAGKHSTAPDASSNTPCFINPGLPTPGVLNHTACSFSSDGMDSTKCVPGGAGYVLEVGLWSSEPKIGTAPNWEFWHGGSVVFGFPITLDDIDSTRDLIVSFDAAPLATPVVISADPSGTCFLGTPFTSYLVYAPWGQAIWNGSTFPGRFASLPWGFTLPSDPTLVGVKVYSQGIWAWNDTQAGILGCTPQPYPRYVTTNVIELTIQA